MPSQPTPQDVAAFAVRVGQDPATVSRLFGLDSAQSTLGSRAQSKLDALINDPEFRNKLNNGDADALDAFNALTTGVAYQQTIDRDEAIRVANEQFAEQQRAEAAEAARTAEAETNQEGTHL